MATKEICIATVASRSGNTVEGDIIVIRDPLPYIGLKEGTNYLWFLVDDTALPSRETLSGSSTKWRYNVPLADLKARVAALDLDRLRNSRDWYQPLQDTNPDTGLHRVSNTPIDISANVTDKESV